MENNILVNDALLLIEQNFYFLHAGEFFNYLSKKKNLSTNNNLNVKKIFENKKEYYFNKNIIKEMLHDSKKSLASETTLFEYFVEMNAFRGICMAMVESLRLDTSFTRFISNKLDTRYEDFFDILSFIRNVLSHNIHANMHLSQKDYEGTLQRILRNKRKSNIKFHINYSKDIPEISSPNIDYGFLIEIDFSKLTKGTAFFDVLNEWQLMMICELCFNFVVSYKIFCSNQENRNICT